MRSSLTKKPEQGRRFAPDAARITDEHASSEDRKHTSGAVCVAADSNLGAGNGKEEEGEDVCGFSPCTSGTQKVRPRGMKL